MEDLDCVVACPELAATGAAEEEALEEPAEAARAARTLLPHRAQESSCSSTGDTPSSTRKLTWRRKYRTAAGRGDGASAQTQMHWTDKSQELCLPADRTAPLPTSLYSESSLPDVAQNSRPLQK